MNETAINWESIPDIITKDQLYQICHISKSTALYLLRSGKIPCEYTGKNSLKSYSPVGTPRKIPLRNTTDKSQWFLGVGHEKRRSKASFSDDMEVT